MDAKGPNILEGEASESDDEDTQSVEKALSNEVGRSSSVVVSGEASESEDEQEDYIVQQDHEFQITGGATVTIEERKPRFKTPFHKKMWERNFSFRHGLVEQHLNRFNDLFARLHSFIPHSNRSLNYAQETLSDYRKISTTSRTLSDNLEISLSQRHLPEFNEAIAK